MVRMWILAVNVKYRLFTVIYNIKKGIFRGDLYSFVCTSDEGLYFQAQMKLSNGVYSIRKMH